ncbi:uncharacterized protein HMPREF1541_04802 [Cyphellophora europaea CBS 101466]|uniref:Helicase ATP-binding domain-containing protein n=1 Tax=Cyphellophora europaea (strain CBS 101466) TaxID=1220924 RepID=W2RW27_CYPE1|nr:uncharacterized protein HMPREF1541_04802 [Cyphellophora europaea CBS 101466]ETN40525.1 hypothetical protein HMPREF1541_04802 [Cyphellophora europaea CBS 101466]
MARGADRGQARGVGRGVSWGRGRDLPSRGKGRGSYSQPRNQTPNWDTTATTPGEINADLPERIRGSYRRQVDAAEPTTGNIEFKLNPDIRKYLHQQENITANAEEGDWLKLPEVPTNEEVALLPEEEVELAPNKIRGKWKSVDRYLKAHFELLREDAMSPLRDAVDQIRKNPDMMDDHTMSIYEKVHIVGFTFSHAGIAARIQFSTYRAQRRILWQGSKRLVSGGLVALTPRDDKFATKCTVAVVAARPLEGLQQNPPEIDLFFIRPEDIEIDPQQEWIMIEAKTGYYEAYRHTLRALQKMSKETFPLSQHICSMSTDIQPPAYVTENPVMDLSAAAGTEAEEGYAEVDVLTDWPGPEKSGLDETQWEALNQILTKSLAVIQGPPGTGKTYVSTVALEILNKYVKGSDSPIIIAAQTNHALDQLLEHVSKFEPNFIRLGGRSTSIEVKKRALWQIRKNERINLIPGSLLGKASSSYRTQSAELRKILEPMHQDPGKPHSVEVFLHHEVLSKQQGESLEAGASRWVSADGAENDPIQLWMGHALVKYAVEYESESFGFDEEDEDLEVEQLKEHEAENGVNDEEDAQDMLQGTWCSVQDHFAVEPPSETALREAARLLDTTQDLWKVPQAMRGPLYHVITQRFKAKLLARFRAGAESYEKIRLDLKTGKAERDNYYLQRAHIIGMTTTGLSKYRHLIASLKPKIVLIEEAAEVFEAPVTVACMPSVEHLILVGDHQQLQAHCSVHELEGEPYYLNVSLFERLVRNNMPYAALLRQRRMDPQFRKLLGPIYPALHDHRSVLQRYRMDWGMGDVRAWFFDHSWLESRDAQMSTYNEDEARFITGFYRYLVLNGVVPDNITILTFYNGQRKRLLKGIRSYPELKERYHNVKTVDSYQGEENTIVILSLARCNMTGKIGFLESRNRVCVALSRAKMGFYLFGSAETISKDPMWVSVVQRMKSTNSFGSHMPVICQRHRTQSRIEMPEHWAEKVSMGGCKERCLEVLPCGHVCGFKCHPFSHEAVSCAVRCEKSLRCGHRCKTACFEECSCDCGTFQRTELEEQSRVTFSSSDARGEDESSREPRSLNTSELDVWRGGKYLSGGHNSDLSEGIIYLPNQGSSLLEYRTADGVNGQMATRSCGMQVTDGWIHNTREYNGRSDSSPFATSRFSEQEQAIGRALWDGYSSGGVKGDDAQRASSTESSPPKGFAKSSSLKQLNSANARDGRGEKTKCMGNGRMKFTQVYQRVTTPSTAGDGVFDDETAKKPSSATKFGKLIDI